MLVCVRVCLYRQSSYIPIYSDWFVREGDDGGLHVYLQAVFLDSNFTVTDLK